jgi:hypothetical protein
MSFAIVFNAWYRACTSDCHPRISIRYDHFGMGDWKGCDQNIYAGYYDPPMALSKVHDLGGDTGPTPAPVRKPTPPPKPAQTAPGDPNNVNNGGQPAQPQQQPSPSSNDIGGLVGIIQSINGPAESPQPQPPASNPPTNNQSVKDPPVNNPRPSTRQQITHHRTTLQLMILPITSLPHLQLHPQNNLPHQIMTLLPIVHQQMKINLV